jgi:SAM-dependent methyltransferase
MDELARFNKERWEGLARANFVYTRPMLNLDATSAQAEVDPHGILGDVTGKDVLCLAASGGQQSPAFGLLGAQVTVFDLAETQLERDRFAAEHYGLHVRTVQGDMRDLSVFADASFDIVYHAYSINFVPDVEPVFAEVARVLRPGGYYHIEWGNPYGQTIDEHSWNGEGYLLRHPYQQGFEISAAYPGWQEWDVEDVDGTQHKVPGPREFVHTLSTVLNGLAHRGFVILHCTEFTGSKPQPVPGTWDHLITFSPAWITLWCAYRPTSA